MTDLGQLNIVLVNMRDPVQINTWDLALLYMKDLGLLNVWSSASPFLSRG